MNPALELLQAYPFERLSALLAGARPPDIPPIAMHIGEPKHVPPGFVIDALRESLHKLDSYPLTRGLPELRNAIAAMLQRRFLPAGASIDPETMVLPVNGTREALFALVQACITPGKDALVVLPNPSYQIYEGAAILAGATPYYLDTTAATRYVPDLGAVHDEIWKRCQLLFLCSPGNPTGAILSQAYLQHALELAERYDFVIAADECYAELYLDEAAPPPSLLRAAFESGRTQFERCAVFHSLSKRSSVPGLRSGFVAGNPVLMKKFLLYRTYHGCAMALPVQLASVVAWNDDAHVAANRALYREKFDRVLPILAPWMEVARPDGAFYLWPQVADDVAFTRALFEQQNLTILPGSYMAREHDGANPGLGRVRISLVASVEECVTAAQRIRFFLQANPA
jgi:N-succinyldiaminopimelate aminotransferase